MLSRTLFLSRAAFFVLALFLLSPAVILYSANSVSASSSATVWTQKYAVNDSFRAETFVQTSDDGFVIAGEIESGVLLLKTDSYGNMEWNQTYGELARYDERSLIETSDGGYALISGTQLVKLDAHGNTEWSRTLLGGDVSYSLIQTSDGGYAIAGTSGDYAHGYEHHFWLAKTDESGLSQWSKTYETVNAGTALSVIQTLDGGFAMLGSNNFNPDFLLVKTDFSGELEWSKQYEKRDQDTGTCIVQNSDGGYTLAGTLWNRSDHNNMAGMIKTDSNGNMLWMKNYPGNWQVLMAGTRDGGYVLCSVLMLTKTDSEGDMLWTRDLNVTIDNDPYLHSQSLIQTHDGGYAILCTASSGVWIIKTDPTGIIPEFPLWTILPLLLTATLVTILYKKRLHKHNNLQSY